MSVVRLAQASEVRKRRQVLEGEPNRSSIEQILHDRPQARLGLWVEWYFVILIVVEPELILYDL